MKIKKLWLATIAVSLFVLVAASQDVPKYIYGVVQYEASAKPTIYSSLDETYEEIKVQKKFALGVYFFDLTPLTEYIKKLNSEGWEVINSSYGILPEGKQQHVYYLRKKIS